MEYKKGTYLIGTVTGIEDYGIFVNLYDDVNGLVHISEIANSYIRNIESFVNVGDKIKVKIVDVDEEKKQLKLSIKNFNYKNLKNNREIIKETKSGFKPLEEKLEGWISNSFSLINEKKFKNIVDK